MSSSPVHVDRYVVVGNPVAHSRSPEIHQAFAAQFGDVIEYTRAEVTLGGFKAFADEFAQSGGRGMNVTVPFKRDAFDYVTTRDDLAACAGAVNTISFAQNFAQNGHSQGFNTDGVGLLNDLVQRHRLALSGRVVLLLGAGGAAAGVIAPLLGAGVKQLIVANRTVAKAQALVAHLQERLGDNIPLAAAGLNNITAPVDIVINATSFSLGGGAVPVAPHIIKGTFCYDMSYGPAAEFCRWAAQNGANTSVDGLGMLVEQAAVAYYLWRGNHPETDPVVAHLRDSL